eukprot:1071414-Lingulodinium_polyedra.AAC.1
MSSSIRQSPRRSMTRSRPASPRWRSRPATRPSWVGKESSGRGTLCRFWSPWVLPSGFPMRVSSGQGPSSS